MLAKRLIRAFKCSSKAVDKIVDLPSLFSVLPNVLWFRRIRRVFFRITFNFFFFYYFVIVFSFFLNLFN